jgi:hypothetical protein
MPNHPTSSAKNEAGDFAQFTNFMRRIVAVPHSKVQERLKAEKRAKSRASRVPVSDKKAR